MSEFDVPASSGALTTYRVERAEHYLGPAMLALTEKQRAFVQALVETGCNNAEAARRAGYQGNADTLKVAGYRCAHDPRVQAAIFEVAQKTLRSGAAIAVKVLVDVAGDPTVEPKDRLRAAAELLNRTGLQAVSEHKVTVEKVQTEREVIGEIITLSKELGLDPRKLLGQAGIEATDADFQVIVEDRRDQP